jgi:hypothetical protein
MDEVSQNGRRKPRPWTPQDQLTAEVAAACGVNYSQIGRALGRDPNVVRCRLNPAAAATQARAVRAWSAANKEKISADAHQRYLDNRDAILAANREWRAANPERIKERNREWRAANAERIKEVNCRWRDANRTKIREQSLAYHWANRESRLQKARIYRQKKKAQRSEAGRAYYAQNRERIQASHRAWHEANREKHRELGRNWREANREKTRDAVRRRHALRRSGRKLTMEPLTLRTKARRFLLWANCCAYCKAGGKQEVDHVLALTQGGFDEPLNVVPACRRCNASKSDAPVESWYRRQPFFTEARWRKIQRRCPAAVVGQLPLALAA